MSVGAHLWRLAALLVMSFLAPQLTFVARIKGVGAREVRM